MWTDGERKRKDDEALRRDVFYVAGECGESGFKVTGDIHGGNQDGDRRV